MRPTVPATAFALAGSVTRAADPVRPEAPLAIRVAVEDDIGDVARAPDLQARTCRILPVTMSPRYVLVMADKTPPEEDDVDPLKAVEDPVLAELWGGPENAVYDDM